MPSRASAAAADTQGGAAPSLAPPDAPEPAEPGPPTDPAPGPRARRRRPGLIVKGVPPAAASESASPAGYGDALPEYPIQVGKVQPPALRDETLARDRLLEWLSIKIHRRVVLLVAEAGYGKTTLLADFTRRTRVRVLWFRLDRGDRDWVGFLAHLVAAVRVHAPEFGAGTRGLLRETATAAPSLETVLDTFLRELGGVPAEASALVLDDFHMVDDSPEVRQIIRELLSRGPDRMSFVFATRREPPIRLARLRAQGEVAELHTDDLRFDAAETEQLFRDTYDLRIEPTMLAELSRRTEGWAASLQLVRAALNDRDPSQVRAFISSLSGAEGHLYDYLAEEVIGDLPDDLQQFLMRTSLLETIDLVLAPVAAGVSVDEARTFIEQAERHGLFGKGGQAAGPLARAHPLVRDFLSSRLHRSLGDEGLKHVHLAIAQAADGRFWRTAAQHYLAAGDEASARRVLAASIETVVGTGAFSAADDVMAALPDGRLGGSAELILRSRLAQQRAASAESLRYAEEALEHDPGSPVVLLNLVTARSLVGDVAGAMEASQLLETTGRTPYAELGRAYRLTMESSLDGRLDVAVHQIESLAELLHRRSEHHFLGVAQLNMAMIRTAIGDPEGALASAQQAIDLLSATSAGVELVSARLARASALSFLAHIDDARAEMALATALAPPGQSAEVAIEVGLIEAYMGDPSRAWPLFDRIVEPIPTESDNVEQLASVRALLLLRANDFAAARAEVALFRHGSPSTAMAFEARRTFIEGMVIAGTDRAGALDAVRSGTALAVRQGAHLWALFGELLGALLDESDPTPTVHRVHEALPAVISMLAEPTLQRIDELQTSARDVVRSEAGLRPWRWRQGARLLLAAGSTVGRREAATLLAEIGEAEDVPRLREASRTLRDVVVAPLALTLARRLAHRVFVEDLGRVRIEIGKRRIEGVDVRRKVLALLCLLVSKPRFASTREEVAEALWPDQDPGSALNSLNQTVYFLRRVFEPDYRDETSPMYVGQDGETIWLDPDLVDSRSRRCADLIRGVPGDPTPPGAMELAREYRGRFALDFAYEEWASGFRESLHASYLRVMERAIQIDLDSGHFNRGTFLAERATEVDPEADEIQAALVRLYRLSGAYAAAAEQYGRYSKTMRELGVEPRPLAEV